MLIFNNTYILFLYKNSPEYTLHMVIIKRLMFYLYIKNDIFQTFLSYLYSLLRKAGKL